MALLQGVVTFGVGATVPLVAATAKTVVQLTAPANQRLKILGYGIYFDGTSTTAQPVEFRLMRQTSAGTGTAQAPVLEEKSLSETLQATGAVNFSVEPTYGDVLKAGTVHPQAGYEYPAPFGQEDVVQGGGRIGIVCQAPAAVNIRGFVKYEEG